MPTEQRQKAIKAEYRKRNNAPEDLDSYDKRIDWFNITSRHRFKI